MRRGSHGLALGLRLVSGLYFCSMLRVTAGIAGICGNEKSLAQNFGFVQGFGVFGLVFLPTW
ncbi:MAG: hypothetical protein LBL39_02340 [Planctomycetaceae bacterium]|nr:hypothetical protein [Planctomycetaceae bacterium]